MLTACNSSKPEGWMGARRLPVLFAGLFALAVIAWGIAGFGAASAQPVAEWSVTLGGGGDDFAHAVALSGDGGYVIAGETRSSGAGSQDGLLVKLDADGTEVWSRTYGGPERDIVYAVQKTSGGGYVLAGETHSAAAASGGDLWLIKTDSEGQVEWQRSYGNREETEQEETEPLFAAAATSDAAHAVRQTSDGGYIVAGSSAGASGTSIWLLRTGPEGNTLWSRNLGDASGALAYDVAEIPGGGFAIAGNSHSGDGGSDALLIRTDSEGNTQWAKSFGGSYNDEGRSLALTADGGYAIGGFTWSYGAGLSDFWLVKADASGEEEWQRSFGGVTRDAAHALIQTGDNGFTLAGWSESFSGGDRFWVVKTGPAGRLQWSSAHRVSTGSKSVSAGARAIMQTGDGGFIVAGWTGAIQGARDILAVKMGPAEEGPPSPSGASAALENTGSASITSAAVGFDTVFLGQPLRFWYKERLIDRDNPLPSGAVACTQPAPGLVSGSRLTLDQIGSFEVVYLNKLASGSSGTETVQVDGEAYSFDFNGDGSGAAGSLSVVSHSPCEGSGRLLPEGPRAPVGLGAEASRSHPGSITLDWADNTESDIFGYAVYLSRSRSGPFVRRAWLLPESGYGDAGTTDGASYYYSVTAINSWGLESPMSAVLRVRSQDFTPPKPPSGLRVATFDRDDGTASLAWNSNSEADLSGYRIYRQDGDGPHAPVTALLFTSNFEDSTLPREGKFTYSITAVDLAGNESGWSNIAPPDLDFFGKVLEVWRNFAGGGSLAVNTARGRVDVEVVEDTEIRAPNRSAPDLGDLTPGDQLAVSLKSDAVGAVARQVHLVPTKTRNRHLAGRVSSLSESEIVVQPLGEGSEPAVFQLSESVQITLHEGVAELTQGQFVIVSFIAADGQTAAALSEINVIPGREPTESPAPPEEPANVAVVRGVFQGINRENANIILSSTEVALDVHTVMTAGVAVGGAVVVEALLLPDGSLLARRLEQDEGIGQVAARTVLRGVFQGRDASSGQWEVSRAQILVDRRTYADALPALGQRVRVTSVLREDGSLYAREIENLSESDASEGEHTVWLEGIFREITAQGAWNVGGLPIRVDASTVLSGRPSVGHRVAVTATAKKESLLATKVSAAPSEQNVPVRSVSIRGAVDQATEGQSLVVDGVRVLLSDLTQTVGNIGVGSTVRVQAELQLNGTLLARQVAQAAAYDETGETRANPVNIEGRIERIEADGGLMVNGIPVAVSALTVIDAALQVGAPVQVRGLLRRDGSVLAREILGYGPGITGGTEASVAGVVERVITGADGRVTGFVIDGISVATDRLTRVEGELTTGVAVVAQAIVIDGEILAVTVEPRPTGSIGALPLVQMQGTVERAFATPPSVPLDTTVNGITVRISSGTNIIGAISGGAVVKVTGSISGGIFLAREIEKVRPHPAQDDQSPVRFNLSGSLEEIHLDSEGQPETLLLAGSLITIVPLTVFQDEVAAGDPVTAEGIIRDGVLLAALVKLEADPESAP